MHKLLAQKVIDTCLAMDAKSINQASAGNISVRCEEGILITPSGLSYDRLKPDDIVLMQMDGSTSSALIPSSEWRMHRDIYERYPEATAVLHAHSNFATALACLRIEIPAFHYMIAVAGGNNIRCADYALFGTQQLSDNMLDALKERRACLLGTHGMICYHDNLDKVLQLAVEIESLAQQYWYARQAGNPVILSEDEMQQVLDKFADYGKQPDRSNK